MTNEELCNRIQQGDREAAFSLFEQNKHLCRRFSARYGHLCPWFDPEDAMQSAFEGLILAALKYDEQRGKFTTVLPFYVVTACRAALGIRSKRGHDDFFEDVRSVSLQAPIDEEGTTLEEIVPDDSTMSIEDMVLDTLALGAVRDAVNELPDVEKDVIKAVYYNGQPCGRERLKTRNKAIQHLYRDKRIKELEVTHRMLTERVSHAQVAALSIQYGTERALEILEAKYTSTAKSSLERK